jgi:hypothetical protein
MSACPVKSSEGGLPKAAFNRVKLKIVEGQLTINFSRITNVNIK